MGPYKWDRTNEKNASIIKAVVTGEFYNFILEVLPVSAWVYFRDHN
jgi:hypothetical protein